MSLIEVNVLLVSTLPHEMVDVTTVKSSNRLILASLLNFRQELILQVSLSLNRKRDCSVFKKSKILGKSRH